MTATEKAQLSGVISEMLLKTTDDLGDLLQIFDSVIFLRQSEISPCPNRLNYLLLSDSE